MDIQRDAGESAFARAGNRAARNAVAEAAAVMEAAAAVEAAAVAEADAVSKSADVVETAAAVKAAAALRAAAAVRAASAVEAGAVVEASAAVGDRAELRQRLLRMANGYVATRSLHHAAEMFFELAEKHPGTLEALQSRKSLLDIGEAYEHNGELHQARSIYERLLAPPPH